MSADWEISQATSVAQLYAVIDLLNVGSGAARIVLYTTARPSAITQPHSDTPQASILLANPAGDVVGGVLELYPQDNEGALVMSQGIPRWGEIVSRAGVVVARADVTDLAHGGGLQVLGGETPEGDTSPLLYAGSKVQLGAVALT